MSIKRMTPDQIARLGSAPDSTLADEFGVTTSAVCRMRKKLGIPPVHAKNSSKKFGGEWTDAEIALLGTDTDEAVAQAIGRSKTAVYSARVHRGIPGFLKAGGKFSKSTHGGAGRGQGRKPISGEAMKPRAVKMTDQQWEDFKLVTPERVRKWVEREAAKMRKAGEPNDASNRTPRDADGESDDGCRRSG